MISLCAQVSFRCSIYSCSPFIYLLPGTLLGTWARSGLPGLVDKEYLIKSIENKAKRPSNVRGGRGLERTAEVIDLSVV